MVAGGVRLQSVRNGTTYIKASRDLDLLKSGTNMRKTLAYCFFFSMLGLTALLAQNKTPPTKLVFQAKAGNITFDHTAHANREKNDCKVCHDKLFAQDAKAPLTFKPPHKNEEDKKTSCGSCHRAGGPAFETKANCTNGKCHVRAAVKKG